MGTRADSFINFGHMPDIPQQLSVDQLKADTELHQQQRNRLFLEVYAAYIAANRLLIGVEWRPIALRMQLSEDDFCKLCQELVGLGSLEWSAIGFVKLTPRGLLIAEGALTSEETKQMGFVDRDEVIAQSNS